MSMRGLRRGTMAEKSAAVVAGETPTYVASSTGGNMGSVSVNTTRPVGTAVGDHLFLIHEGGITDATPPTLTDWTLLSGYDLDGPSTKFAVHHRIATLTADDQPTLTLGTGWNGGWAQVAIRGGATISVPPANTHNLGTVVTGPVITTTATNSLILSIAIVGNNGVVGSITGPTDRYHFNMNYIGIGVGTEGKAAPGVGAPLVATLSASYRWLTYALALTA